MIKLELRTIDPNAPAPVKKTVVEAPTTCPNCQASFTIDAGVSSSFLRVESYWNTHLLTPLGGAPVLGVISAHCDSCGSMCTADDWPNWTRDEDETVEIAEKGRLATVSARPPGNMIDNLAALLRKTPPRAVSEAALQDPTVRAALAASMEALGYDPQEFLDRASKAEQKDYTVIVTRTYHFKAWTDRQALRSYRKLAREGGSVDFKRTIRDTRPIWERYPK